MAGHITTAGAFYGFISNGLGQVWGMASGLLATFAYVVFERSLIGGCAYFANDAVNSLAGVNIPWLGFAVAAIVVIAALCHFHISLTAAILGVTLISEVLLLLALAISVIVRGGGPDGFMLDQTVLPQNAFQNLPADAFGIAAAAGSMAIGLFFAFWSWVYGLLALIGTAAIMLVLVICSVAVIWYFWVRKVHRGNVITTLICPLLGGSAMAYVVCLL